MLRSDGWERRATINGWKIDKLFQFVKHEYVTAKIHVFSRKTKSKYWGFMNHEILDDGKNKALYSRRKVFNSKHRLYTKIDGVT